jgi:hypothetical protein
MKNEKGGASGTYRKKEKCTQWENLEGNDHLEDQSAD